MAINNFSEAVREIACVCVCVCALARVRECMREPIHYYKISYMHKQTCEDIEFSA